MCGDHNVSECILLGRRGSPPHVRGPPEMVLIKEGAGRITPACAGTTVMFFYDDGAYGDHPRMCGDHLPSFKLCQIPGGSFPHVRGPLTFI